ncbi:HamA C-terminal domain-containing protein [Thalassolituus oleivorans]|uniref:HamA C-terminal domain-containing protein n=1 Tax=Thalassolituus oleivorans TaxID=187493 RepID=UPI0024093446|nr:DUF1837 domain-containing protein [Thalassolituus oleivorans]MDF1641547.1 DUF1837 domain-containing protein [Thalassolituus oleivorans]
MEYINSFTSVDLSDYNDCLGVLEHEYSIDGVSAKIRMHYVKFDANGCPMIKALANMLYSYIIDYCISSKNRSDVLSARQSAILTKQARDLFRHPKISENTHDRTGEAGEILLYFLMEAVLNAPQVVSKMELKTNHRDEVKGSDGIHARYDPNSGIVDFFFGESKLYTESSSAITDAINSVEQFHDISMYQHEFTMVTKHFKYADEVTKNAISSLIVHGEPGANVRINHACLIGYDFKGFKELPYGKGYDEFLQEFLDRFLKDGSRLTRLLQKRFDIFERKSLCFEVFLIPFPSVDDFRNAFNVALD